MQDNNNTDEIVHANDSSDDEEVGAFYPRIPKAVAITAAQLNSFDIFFKPKKPQPLKSIDIAKFMEQFQHDVGEYYGYPQDSNWCWYFILHQLGIGLLYHPQVEAFYKEKKRSHIGKSHLYSPYLNDNQIKQVIQNTSPNQKISPRTAALILTQREKWLSNSPDSLTSQKIEHALRSNAVSLVHHALRDDHLFVSNNTQEYLANIRLLNRNLKRHMSHMRQYGLTPNTSPLTSTWSLLPNNQKNTIDHKITRDNAGNYSRTDHTRSFDAYVGNSKKSVISRINKIKRDFPELTDARIAKNIRTTLKHQPISYEDQIPKRALTKTKRDKLNNFFVAITNLLFGIEGARTPEALILHQMILDLIMLPNSDWTWERVLNEEFSGSFNKGVVPTMRTTNNDLHPYLSHPYYYPGPLEDTTGEDNIKNLYDTTLKNFIVKQNNIVNTWRLTCHNDINSYELLTRIQSQYEEWFGMECPNNEVDELAENLQRTNVNVN